MGGDGKYSPRKFFVFEWEATEIKRKTHTHDNFIVLVVRGFSFGGGMVHAYCRSVTIFSSDLQKFCYVNRHEATKHMRHSTQKTYELRGQ